MNVVEGQQMGFLEEKRLEYGLSGAQLEEMLNRHGIQVYGKMICTEGDTYPAFVLVDKSRERQVRRFFAKLGVTTQAPCDVSFRASGASRGIFACNGKSASMERFLDSLQSLRSFWSLGMTVAE
jgi:hypothetical protein